jgi:hypothetical protein
MGMGFNLTVRNRYDVVVVQAQDDAEIIAAVEAIGQVRWEKKVTQKESLEHLDGQPAG